MKKPNFKLPSFKEDFKSRTFRVGTYSAFISLAVLAIVVAANLLFAELPASIQKTDLTDEALFSISEQTESITRGVEEDVTIYLIAQTGSEDEVLSEMLRRYADFSDHIKIVHKDPVIYPSFTAAYTDESVYDNSLVVESAKRFRYVPYSDIYVTEYDYESYYTTGQLASSTTYNGENEVTSAIDYVTSDVLPKVYTLSGHGEATLSASFKAALGDENVEYVELSLLTASAVPSDCDCLLILSPATDISEGERDMILSYMKLGGNVILYTDYQNGTLKNLSYIAQEYGLAAGNGLVIEGDDNHHLQGFSYYLLPTLESDEITAPIANAGYSVLVPFADGITELDQYRSTITIKPLLTTSDKAYAKAEVSEGDALSKEAADKDGPFYVGVRATEVYNEVETNFIWFSSVQMLDENLDSYVSGANRDLFLNAISSVCGRSESVSIRAKTLSYNFLSMTAAQVGRMSLIVIGVVPMLFLAAGIFVWIRRKKS